MYKRLTYKKRRIRKLTCSDQHHNFNNNNNQKKKQTNKTNKQTKKERKLGSHISEVGSGALK
jgi:hypothetical protein